MSHNTINPEETSSTGYSTLAVVISAIAGIVAAVGSYLLVKIPGTVTENLYRVQPTVEHRGVGSDWVVSNSDPLLNAMITLIHVADVIMGLFILMIVFINWAAFRRLADRMRQPHEADRRATATDGGSYRDTGETHEVGDEDHHDRHGDDVTTGGDG